jgi:eukaryotic-like serine/threonine-protein kinase
MQPANSPRSPLSGSAPSAVASEVCLAEAAETVPNVGARHAPRPQAQATPGIRSGEIIEGKYKITAVLGEGAMGVVALALDEALQRYVAVKLIRPQIRAMRDFQARFLREARAMASIRHENVVAIHSFGEHDGAPYFVMEYVPGTSLERWLALHAPLDIDVALGVLGQVCRGVQAIHDAGAVHLDIKPANVLIGPGFRIAVTDLGLARPAARGAKSDSHAPGGTPHYMAPEAVFANGRSEEDWARVDIYALGVLAFELLTGQLPFQGESAASVLMQQISATPPNPSAVRSELPCGFDEPVLAALAKSPEDRPASAIQFYERLMSVRSSRPPAPATRILVADDDSTFRALARSVLQGAIPGAEVTCVPDGTAALAHMDEHPPDLLLLDLQMPEMNGLEVMAALRGSGRAPNTRVLVASAVGTTADWKVLSDFEADAFLVKPVTAVQLARAVTRLLGLPEPPGSSRARTP